MALTTDVAVLAKEAGNFERISGELQGVIHSVEATASSLQPQWVGQAGAAAQAAFVRYQEAAARQIQELNDISANIAQAGIQYATTDEDAHSTVAGALGI
jgi:WXG100 family type VII secretion target